MEELFVVILTIFVNDVWNLPRISLMESWTQHPILLNLFHHKLFLTLQNQNSLNQNKIFLQRSPLLRGMTVLNVVIPGGIVDLLIDMGIDSFKEGGVSENRTIMYCLSCSGSVFIIIIAPGLPVLHQYNLYFWHLYVSVHSINRAISIVYVSWCY